MPAGKASGQACDCPALTTCAPCAGGLTSLTLRFNGSSAATITAEDQIGVVFSGLVNPGTTFTFAGSLPNEKFVGPNVTMTVNAAADASISSLCGSTELGSTHGSFTVMAALSKTGGQLCCPAGLLETVPPVISNCPSNIVVSAPANACGTAVTWTSPTASDNCSLESLTPSQASGTNFAIGTTLLQYTARDIYGNTATCAFSVTVNDVTPPQISNCPANITLAAGNDCTTVASWAPPTVSDNCSATLSSSHAPGTSFPVGTTTVTFTATDGTGNSSTCSFNVVIADNQPPVLSACPADITVEAMGCQATVNWTPPTATDNCSATVSGSHLTGSVFPFGTTPVTYTAVDDAGNQVSCSFNVHVVDVAAPVFTGCPTNVMVSTNASCQATATWTPPVASDNCSATVTSTHSPGATFSPGETLVTYTASDPSGNQSTCSFLVVVNDNQPPVFTGCPSNITVTTTACESAVTWVAPAATDNCSSATTITSSHSSGAVFPLGTTVVTYQAQDASGNSATCTFNVVVTNNATPVVQNCPADILLKTTGDAVVVSWQEPDATSSCGTVTTTRSHAPGDAFPAGTTTVTYQFTSQAGNTASCSFNILVEDEVLQVDVGQAITPDGDGHNDTWHIGNIEKFPDNSVLVVDRWGNRIFEAVGYDNLGVRWEGISMTGTAVPTGTYFYTISFRTEKATARQTGFIEVVR